MENPPDEYIWVGTSGGRPDNVYTSREQVVTASLLGKHRYIEAFDRDGVHIRSYHLQRNMTYREEI